MNVRTNTQAQMLHLKNKKLKFPFESQRGTVNKKGIEIIEVSFTTFSSTKRSNKQTKY